MYMERYGLLRPGSSTSALPSAIPPYPPLGFPSYLNFRYPSPGLLHSDLGLVNNGMDLNRFYTVFKELNYLKKKTVTDVIVKIPG
jgi:hypothetical protein